MWPRDRGSKTERAKKRPAELRAFRERNNERLRRRRQLIKRREVFRRACAISDDADVASKDGQRITGKPAGNRKKAAVVRVLARRPKTLCARTHKRNKAHAAVRASIAV